MLIQTNDRHLALTLFLCFFFALSLIWQMKKNFSMRHYNSLKRIILAQSARRKKTHIFRWCVQAFWFTSNILLFSSSLFLLWAVNCFRAHFTSMTFIFLLKWAGYGNPCQIRKIVEIWYISARAYDESKRKIGNYCRIFRQISWKIDTACFRKKVEKYLFFRIIV